jgi:hypothetical protein
MKQISENKIFTEMDVDIILESYQSEFDNNIELSEYRNDILFNMLSSSHVDILIYALCKDEKALQHVQTDIENPISDDINIGNCIMQLKNVHICISTKTKIIESLKVARHKYLQDE